MKFKRSWAVTLIVTDTYDDDAWDYDESEEDEFLSKAQIIKELRKGDLSSGLKIHQVKARLMKTRENVVPPKKRIARPIRRIRG